MENKIQIIGADIGRGYVKGYTEHDKIQKECLFKSVVGIGRSMDFKNYNDPIFLEVGKEEYFAGILAEKEGYTPTRNSRDSKTSPTVEKLLYALLSKLAIEENVKIMLGVPNKNFKKSTLTEIVERYKDKKIKIKDKINGGYKDINIVDIQIFREGDSALLWQVRNDKENTKPIGLVSIGFRSTELSYFDKGLAFNDKKSKTIDNLGNRTSLEFVQKELESNNIMKDLNEIDSNNDDYEELKKIGYNNLQERVLQEIEDIWINLDEMDIYICGGTALKMDWEFDVLDDAQMATAKGLYLVGTRIFK
ncbi:ParM/StbA family protein [Clostridium niameyense]|uniref:ParM/StbA family protein n=1 Tax=Clostridium niameyense TaxID=1622073 RepID=A0A6M0RCB6_9CLOT|nr:ParM/StbA family protein [Clostridium niameyense]NEZ47843.1 ParM/StbA family protein [Clostridium niameyense]